MKTVSEIGNRNVSDKTSNKKGTRKFLQTLQPSGGDKENLVGSGRTQEKNIDSKISKSQVKTEVEVKLKDKKSIVAKVNPSLYKKLIIDDLTSSDGPSEKYWEVIAERRRKALEDVLKQNNELHGIIMALEEENVSCKKLLEETTDLVNTLKEILNEDDGDEEDDSPEDKSLSIDLKKPNNKINCSDSSSSESE